MHAYCLFCETQKCALIARLIEERYGIRCISPQIIQRKWVKGICEEKRHSWLPGYVFLYADHPVEEIRTPGIIRWLGKGELRDRDLAFALMLYEKNGVMGTIRLAEVGDRCVVNEPLWQSMEGRVVKIDRGRKRCCVEFTFDNAQMTAWVGYELVQPAEQEQAESDLRNRRSGLYGQGEKDK